ncbi:MAG: acyl-CoA dehydrogenase family protein [Xanthobacteraceae bacterium]|jgi:acyl-CoA dehydrogenase
MDFDLPEDLRMLKKTVADFVDRELIPIEQKTMDGPLMRADMREQIERKARDLGLWLLEVPVEYGGQGLGCLGMVVVWEELARTIALPPRGPLIFGPDIRPILFTLSEAQKEKYLFPVLRGEKVTAFAQSEPDAGSDPGSMHTTAVRKGDCYVINGYKRWITNAANADFFQLVAATDRGKGSRGGLSMFLVDAQTPGITLVGRTHTMMGDEPYEIAFDNVEVPAENLIGQEGDGMKSAQTWITSGRLYQACRGLGVAKRCLDLAARYSKQRVTFGAPLAERQAVQFMLADSYMEHHMAQLLVYQLAARTDAGVAARHESYMAKIAGTELGFRVADRCMQIHGGMGLATELPVSKMWRDARSFMITEGPVEIMRWVLAREILRAY